MRDRGLWAWLRRSENRHWLMLLFWPVYLLIYELAPHLAGDRAICTATVLDDYIPFRAAFALPYLMWFPFWMGTLLYAGLKEPKLFVRTMRYFMLTFSIAGTLFLLLPTTTGLRPEVPEQGFFNWVVRLIYLNDADACVYPSEHIIGLFAVLFAVWDSEGLSKPAIKACTVAIALMIGASTMYTKQHAAIDVIAALPVSALGGLMCYRLPRQRALALLKQFG